MTTYTQILFMEWCEDHKQAKEDILKYCGAPDIEYLFDGRSADQREFDDDFERSLRSTADEINAMEDDFDQVCEYLEDILDYDVRRNSDGSYDSCRVWITMGGPGVFIDTSDGYLKGRWGSTRIDIPLSCDVCNLIDDYIEELTNCY